MQYSILCLLVLPAASLVVQVEKPHKLKVSEKVIEKVDKSRVVLHRNGNNEVQKCDACRGDPSDMVHSFYRYSKTLEREQVFGKQITEFSLPADTYFWNAKETTQCLKDKYILMLGDSTLLENLNDLIILEAGGPHKHRVSQLHHQMGKIEKDLKYKLHTPNGMMEIANQYNRNQTITLKKMNTLLRFRFIGHQNMQGTCEGLKSILTEELKQEVDMMVENGGRRPDAIIIQSGSHDMCNNRFMRKHLDSFFDSIDKVGSEIIRPWKQSGINVIWRGNARFLGEDQNNDDPTMNNDMRYPVRMDDVAKEMAQKNGAKFVDTAAILAGYHDDETGCCKTISSATTTFPHLGSVSVRQFNKASAFYSQLISYKLLDSICPHA